MNNIPVLSRNAPISREEFAYDAIKEAILSGELLPNQKISLTELAKNLGVSIIPVNNAVRRLTSEGLIRQDPHHSPHVEEFKSKAVNEVLLIRYHLEELALREAIDHIGEEELKVLRGYIDVMKVAVQEKDYHIYGLTNRSFHMAIYASSSLPMLCDLITDLWNKAELNRCRSVFSLVPNMAEHSLNEHVQLLDLVEKKDIEGAVNVLKKHKNYSRAKLLESLENLGE